MSEQFITKDSGQRATIGDSGMVRDTAVGKTDYTRVLDGPMFERWTQLLVRGEEKYPDVRPGVPNWTLADDEAAFQRFTKSAFRHFVQWIRGDRDEDHAAAVFFNVNGAEYTRGRIKEKEAFEAALDKERRIAFGAVMGVAQD